MEQNLPPLPPVIFENGLYYELRGEQYYPCLLPPESDTTEDKLLKIIIRQMAEAQGINEDLKARDQMAWVGAMNNIKSKRQLQRRLYSLVLRGIIKEFWY